MRRAVAPLLLAVLLTSCSDPRVSLGYRAQEGTRLRYALRLSADVERTLQGRTTVEHVEATFRAEQEVLEVVGGGGSRVRITLDPVRLAVDGVPESPGAEQEFVVAFAPDGQIRALEDAPEQGVEPLAPVGIERLLPRLRPVLPQAPVAPGDEWTSRATLMDEDGRFSLEARSRLAQLGKTAGRRAALVRTTYASPVDRREMFANAVAELEGRDVGAQEAWFSLEGVLLRSESDSVGRYGVTFRPPGGRTGVPPVEGRLRVRLRTEMRLLG